MLYRCDHYALFPSRVTLDAALQWLSGVAIREGWTARLQFGLALCLDEALNNVIDHAFDQHHGNNLALITLSCQPTAIVLDLRDNGRPFDPTGTTPAALAPALDAATPGGHGLRLIRHFVNDLYYQRESGWNRLTLAIAIEQPSDNGAPLAGLPGTGFAA